MNRMINRMIFVNLPVADLAAARAFYTGLGFGVNEQFCDDQSACIAVSETIFVMLLQRERFADFVTGRVADPAAGTSAIVCITARDRAEVDDLIGRALAGGGRPWLDRMSVGPTYGGSFADPDGHVWEVITSDLSAA